MNNPYQFAYSSNTTSYSVVQNDSYHEESSAEDFLIKLYAVILLLGSTLSCGGSWLTRSSSSTAYQINYISDQSQVTEKKNDFSEKFQTIKQAFNLSIVEQAKLFDVSRQSIYKWIRGDSQIKSEHLILLNELEKAALLLLKENYASVLFTEKVIVDGLTITELVKETKDAEKTVSLLIEIVNREEKEKNALKSLLDF